MKKLTSVLAVACLAIGSMTAQTQRMLLYEEFTGENCPPCASVNPGLHQLLHSPGNYNGKILMVKYQCNIPSAPGAGSLYQDNPTEVGTRQSYYSVPFAPYARLNGLEIPDIAGGGANDGHAALLTQTIINDSAIANAPFSLDVAYAFNTAQDSVTITSTITAAQAVSTSSLVLHMAMEEAEIHFTSAPGSNGEKDFYDVMRKMIPNASGTAINSTWTMGQSQVVTLKAKIPTYIKNKNQLCFVGWIQHVPSKRVHQAGYGKLNTDMGAISLGASASCVTSFAPTIVVKNWGSGTVNSYDLVYKIDAAATQTITGTGTPLAPGASATVTLPSGTYAIGSHSVTANTSMPNGSADMFAGNDAMLKSYFYVYGTGAIAPIVEGFQGTTYPPTNWGRINGGSTTYQWVSANYGGFQASTKCSFMNLWDAPKGDVDELLLPPLDMSALSTAQLSFDIGKGKIPGQADRMQVLASPDCGVTWTTLYDKDDNTGLSTVTFSTAAWFPSSASQWRTDNIPMNSFAGNSNVLVKFVTISDYSQNIFIDNINLSGTSGISGAASNLANVSVYPNPASTEVKVTVSLISAQAATVNVFNAVGALVYSEARSLNAGDNEISIQTSALADGLYTVQVATNGELTTKKLTIAK